MPVLYKHGLEKSTMDEVEQKIGKALPLELRDFLSRMNGFYLTSPDFVELPLAGVDEGVISLDRFFGFIPEQECNDIVAFNLEFVDELDFLNGTIAIGEDGGGNPYVIVAEPGMEGVYYWDRTHLHEADSKNQFDIPERNGSGNLFFVAPNFNGLYELVMKSLNGDPDFVEEKK